jgi:glyoxylase-like metal-dependent hydrolase (beta-lactamase superfamily II)
MAVHVLDTLQLGNPGVIAATAVETSDGVVLFDTGPESTFANITAALSQAGAQPTDVQHVFLSHIHLDHAGAAWRFAKLGTTVYVHPRGAPHLTDPTNLVSSATRIFGDAMKSLWGRIEPVPSRSVRILLDGETVRAGGLEIRATETPGHASHHHVYSWEENLFGGDIAGVRIGGGPPIPPFVPPELHIESWLESIDKMRTIDAAHLYLPHFGRVNDSLSSHFDALEKRVREWSIWFRDQMRVGNEEAQLVPAFADYEAADLRAGGATEENLIDYEQADPSFMAVGAALRYWRKYHPEELQTSASR